jgi:signal transduction histidine kinase
MRRDAMPDGGTFTLEAANWAIAQPVMLPDSELAAGVYVALTVRDTGAGMSAEVQARAFEPFFTTEDVGEGAGLGLSMAHGFGSQSGGSIEIDSQPGAGTAVTLYLTRAMAEAVEKTGFSAGVRSG